MLIKCELCGEAFWTTQKTRRFCSRGCYGKWLSRTMSKKPAPEPVKPSGIRLTAAQYDELLDWIFNGGVNPLGGEGVEIEQKANL